jgi:hypothetical protein
MRNELVCEELTYPGVYRGKVADNNDPEGMLRIRAFVPRLLGESPSCWALPCLLVVPSSPPPVGAAVWIMFEGGEVNWPVWLGQWFTPGQVTGQVTSGLIPYSSMPARAVPGGSMPAGGP